MSADLDALIAGTPLSTVEAERLLSSLLASDAADTERAAFVAAYAASTPSPDELRGYLNVLQREVSGIEAPSGAIDTCGTGGDGLNTINVSTAAAIVAATCGVPVAKHGNRAMSSTCGSADVLEELGAHLDMPPAASEQILAETGFAFLFAQLHHPALAAFAPVRRRLRLRTVFNLLGPIANPARVTRQVIGVAREDHAQALAAALQPTAEHILIVRGLDGMDELSPSSPSEVIELRRGEMRSYVHTPAPNLGSGDDLRLGGGVPEAAERLLRVLDGSSTGQGSQAVALNAGAALVVGDAAGSIEEGYELARATLAVGSPAKFLRDWIRRSRELGRAS